MTLASFLSGLRETLQCVTTQSYGERGCRFNTVVSGITLVTVDGSKYQKVYGHSGKLADRIIFGQWRDYGFVCAVEFKSGDVGHVSDVLDQLQRAMDVAEDLLADSLIDDWYPVLLHGRRISTIQSATLAKNRIRFRGRPKQIILRRCGASLIDLLEIT